MTQTATLDDDVLDPDTAPTHRSPVSRTSRRHKRIPLPLAGLLLVYVAANLYPFVWMLATSFKTRTNSFADSGIWPSPASTEGWRDAWHNLDAGSATLNSLLYSGLTVAGVLIVYPMAGFALALIRFRGRDVLFGLLVSGLLVPGIVLLIPTVILAQDVHLINTWPGVLLPTITAAGPIPLYLMRNYFRLLPPDLLEAARIDGASYFATYRRIYLPLSAPALATVSILTLVYVWNSYILPSLLLTDSSKFTLPLALYNLDATGDPGRNVIMAAAIMVIIPLIVAFLALQRYYIAGLAAGATK
jgi:multiple sugar transport system permease protein